MFDNNYENYSSDEEDFFEEKSIEAEDYIDLYDSLKENTLNPRLLSELKSTDLNDFVETVNTREKRKYYPEFEKEFSDDLKRTLNIMIVFCENQGQTVSSFEYVKIKWYNLCYNKSDLKNYIHYE